MRATVRGDAVNVVGAVVPPSALSLAVVPLVGQHKSGSARGVIQWCEGGTGLLSLVALPDGVEVTDDRGLPTDATRVGFYLRRDAAEFAADCGLTFIERPNIELPSGLLVHLQRDEVDGTRMALAAAAAYVVRARLREYLANRTAGVTQLAGTRALCAMIRDASTSPRDFAEVTGHILAAALDEALDTKGSRAYRDAVRCLKNDVVRAGVEAELGRYTRSKAK